MNYEVHVKEAGENKLSVCINMIDEHGFTHTIDIRTAKWKGDPGVIVYTGFLDINPGSIDGAIVLTVPQK